MFTEREKGNCLGPQGGGKGVGASLVFLDSVPSTPLVTC